LTSNHFFVSRDRIDGSTAVLQGSENHHFGRVLRGRTGDEVWLFDEDGVRYRARVDSLTRVETRLAILEKRPPLAIRTRLVLAQALLKAKTMDDVVQRSAELGAARIVPVESDRSISRPEEKAERKAERWARIALEAAKQSRGGRPPAVDRPVPLAVFLADPPPGRRIVLTERRGAYLRDIVAAAAAAGGPPDAAVLLVGPEGGWTEAEEGDIIRAGFEAVSLGLTILRAETASLGALAILAHHWNW
jgi:16S rRNA (uracil1498-N3)-methyltransferase